MQARVNPDASVLLQASPALLDEFKYNEEIDVSFDESSGTYVLTGNWYQLEWAWTYLDTFLQQQEVIQDEIKHQPFRNVASPLDVEDGGGGDVGVARPGAAESGIGTRENKKSDFYPENVDTERKSGGRISVAQSLSRSSARQEETTRKDPAADRNRSTTHQGRRSPAGIDSDDEYGDRDDLTGRGYVIPDDSIPMSMHHGGLDRRADQESTFDQFSGLNLAKERKSETNDRMESERHQQMGMSRSGKQTDNTDRQEVWLSDSSRKIGSSIQGADKTDRKDVWLSDTKRTTGSSIHGADVQDRDVGTKMRGLQTDRTDSSDRQKPKGIHRSPDTSPDRGDDFAHRNPSKGYQSLPVQGYDRGTGSSYATKTDTRLGAFGTENRSSAPFGETFTKDHMQYQFTVGDVAVLILHGDLVQESTDAIVNPANSGLEHWGGASYAISRAAGPELDKQCRDFIAKNGHLKVADVMHTTGGNLPATHVLHTYGPIWYESGRKEKTEYDLMSTFLNCFNYAENLQLGSLCVPAISTGK